METGLNCIGLWQPKAGLVTKHACSQMYKFIRSLTGCGAYGTPYAPFPYVAMAVLSGCI